MKTINSKPQSDICWTSTCAILLLHIQNAAQRICPAFYYERRVSHNERMLSILSETEFEKTKSLLLIEKELFMYNYFAHQDPKTVVDPNDKYVKCSNCKFGFTVNPTYDEYGFLRLPSTSFTINAKCPKCGNVDQVFAR